MPLAWHHGVTQSQKKAAETYLIMTVSDKSKCLLVEGGKICGQFIKGKNPTNLKVHLRSAHKEANLAYLNKLKENARGRPIWVFSGRCRSFEIRVSRWPIYAADYFWPIFACF